MMNDPKGALGAAEDAQVTLALARARNNRKEEERQEWDKIVMLVATLLVAADLARSLGWPTLQLELTREADSALEIVEAKRVVFDAQDDAGLLHPHER